jgi:hypothetical protein
MSTNEQHVILQGGSYDGRVAKAAPPPEVLQIGIQNGSDKWTESYIYTASPITGHHEEYGDLPIMVFFRKTDEA